MTQLKVRDNPAEIVIKDGKKEFKYAHDLEGKMRIVAVSGLKKEEDQSVLNRLLNAEPKNCSKCLEGELADTITILYFLNFL